MKNYTSTENETKFGFFFLCLLEEDEKSHGSETLQSYLERIELSKVKYYGKFKIIQN